MLNEIIEAIKNNEIRAYIQPQFDTVTGKMVSGEAAVPIAVNFSRRHIYEPDFIDKLKDIFTFA